MIFLIEGCSSHGSFKTKGFLVDKLKSSFQLFYSRHYDLVDRYGIPVSHMTTEMFRLS